MPSFLSISYSCGEKMQNVMFYYDMDHKFYNTDLLMKDVKVVLETLLNIIISFLHDKQPVYITAKALSQTYSHTTASGPFRTSKSGLPFRPPKRSSTFLRIISFLKWMAFYGRYHHVINQNHVIVHIRHCKCMLSSWTTTSA